MKKKICIIGAGGFAKEVHCLAIDIGLENDIEAFIESDDIWQARSIHGLPVKPLSFFDEKIHAAVVAIGDPSGREKVVKLLPKKTEYITLIHPNVVISKWVKVGEGSIICSGCNLTTDIVIGKHAHLNLDTTIGHDCQIGDYFTTAPSVNISGNCQIGNKVYMGTAACVREKLVIASGTMVGMGGVVVKSIESPGVYIGNPVKKIR